MRNLLLRTTEGYAIDYLWGKIMKKNSGMGCVGSIAFILVVYFVIANWRAIVLILAISICIMLGIVWTVHNKNKQSVDGVKQEESAHHAEHQSVNTDTLNGSEKSLNTHQYSDPGEDRKPDSVHNKPTVTKPREGSDNPPLIHHLRRKLYDFVVFDIETTGLSKHDNEIIQLSAIKVAKDAVVDEFDTYVKPEVAIPNNITLLTGITNDNVTNAPDVINALASFRSFVGDLPLVGHNIYRFDLPFIIAKGFDMAEISALDTWKMAQQQIFDPQPRDLKLPTLKKYFDIHNKSHNAIEDCKTNLLVYQRMRDGQVQQVVSTQTWPQTLSNLRFVITGEFTGISREELTDEIRQYGGRVSRSVSKLTDYLLDGVQIANNLTDGIHSASELRAKELQQNGGKIRVLTLSALRQMEKGL